MNTRSVAEVLRDHAGEVVVANYQISIRPAWADGEFWMREADTLIRKSMTNGYWHEVLVAIEAMRK